MLLGPNYEMSFVGTMTWCIVLKPILSQNFSKSPPQSFCICSNDEVSNGLTPQVSVVTIVYVCIYAYMYMYMYLCVSMHVCGLRV